VIFIQTGIDCNIFLLLKAKFNPAAEKCSLVKTFLGPEIILCSKEILLKKPLQIYD